MFLSECSKAIAREALRIRSSTEEADRLIFPAPSPSEDWADLKPWAFDDDGQAPKTDFTCSNVLLIRLSVGDPSHTASMLRAAAVERLRTLVQSALDQTYNGNALADDLVPEILDYQRTQLAHALEIYVAWCALGESYANTYRTLNRLFDGRKRLREFKPWQGAEVPKSSLDGLRESVLNPILSDRRFPIWTASGEELDLLGLAKRVQFGSDAIRFPSVSRFAVDPWLRLIPREKREGLITLVSKLASSGVLRQRRAFADAREDDPLKFPWWDDFPFEGTVLHESRHPAIREEAHTTTEDDHTLDSIRSSVRELSDDYGEPGTYYALIRADGDQIGRRIHEMAKKKGLTEHREFSRKLTEWNLEVHQQICGRAACSIYRGATIYAGADDVLCFAPVDQSLAIARWLYRSFKSSVGGTLSVGVAVAHALEPLEDVLGWAKAAENHAKEPEPDEAAWGQQSRDGLAVHVHSRGGAPLSVRRNWAGCLDVSLTEMIAVAEGGNAPSSAAYALRELALRYDPARERWANTDDRQLAMRNEALPIMRKMGAAEANRDIAHPSELLDLAHEWLIAQALSRFCNQKFGKLDVGREI